MRSTQKKGPRTLGLMRAKHGYNSRARAAAAVEAMYAATSAAQVCNAAWANGIALLNSGFDAHGAAADAISRAAGFREPPEPEPAIQSTPKKPLAPTSGAARPISMTTLPSGNVRLDIGDESVEMTHDESRRVWVLTEAPRTFKVKLRAEGATTASKVRGEINRLYAVSRPPPPAPDKWRPVLHQVVHRLPAFCALAALLLAPRGRK